MNFVKNVGFVDQVVRSLLILDVVAAYLLNFISGFSALLLFGIATILVASCLTGYCPLYTILGLSTRQETEKGN